MDSDAEHLRERVAELEETVDEQQSLIEKMMPSRRQILTGAGMAGAYALGGGMATAADTSDGRHAAKFGQYSEIEGPSDNTHLNLIGGGPIRPQFAIGDSNNQVPGTSHFNGINAESLVIGGTLYDEDDNSPLDVSGTSSTTYTVGQDFDEVIVIPDMANPGFDELQVNGDTGSNYDYVDNSDTQTTGQTEFSIPFFGRMWYLTVRDVSDRVRIGVALAHSNTGITVGGQNSNLGGNGINSLDFSDSGGSNRTAKARIYGRSV